jgi:hypothetical protein
VDPAQQDRGAVVPTLNATLQGISGVIVIVSSPIVFTLIGRSLAKNARWTGRTSALRASIWWAWIGIASFWISLVLYNAVQQPGTLDVRFIVSSGNRFMILTYAAWMAICAYQVTGSLDVGGPS